MPIYLNSNSGSLIEFQDGLPINYSGPLLRGSKVLYFAKDACQLIIQEIITELYTLRLNVFRFMEALTFDSVSNKEGIHSRILLKGNLRHKVKGTGKINLREGEFTMLWLIVQIAIVDLKRIRNTGLWISFIPRHFFSN